MSNTATEDELKRLPDLYSLTGWDWEINIQHSLTEPTCPTIIIREEPLEDDDKSRYWKRFDSDSFHAGVKAAVDFILSDLENIKKLCPRIEA